jgi:hypothetical protein
MTVALHQSPTVLVVLRHNESLHAAGVCPLSGIGYVTLLLLNQETVSYWPALDAVWVVEHGLQLETVEKKAVIPIHEPPLSCKVIMFATSNHPLVVQHFSHVQQWEFSLGQTVCLCRGDWSREIMAITDCGVKVTHSCMIVNGNKKQKIEEAQFLG